MARLTNILAGAAGLAIASTALADGQAQIQRGKQVFQYWCATCHAPGDEYPGTVALQAKYKGEKPAPLEERKDLNPELVKFFVRNGVSIMPFFRKTEVSDADLAAIGAYLAKPAK